MNTNLTAIVVSLNFRVAHISHLIASYKQMEELGYNAYLLIHPGIIPYLPSGIKYITSLKSLKAIDLAIFWFPSKHNIKAMLRLKRNYKSKIIYVLHEPLESISKYREANLSNIEIFKIHIKYLVSLIFLYLSDSIILPSNKALNLYEKSICRKINSKYMLVPLLFDDESDGTISERQYFSYIGTIAKDHAYAEFISFIIRAAYDSDIPNTIRFLIATRNKVIISSEMAQLIENGRLKIVDGKPLTDQEINYFYASSIAVWNAYHRTTQSGVLAKASMFGTPSLVCRNNLSEFSIEDMNVISCERNNSYSDLKMAFLKIYSNFDRLSNNARHLFLNRFYYKIHNSNMKTIIDSLIDVK